MPKPSSSHFTRESEFEFRALFRALRSSLQDLSWSDPTAFPISLGRLLDQFLKTRLALETLPDRCSHILSFTGICEIDACVNRTFEPPVRPEHFPPTVNVDEETDKFVQRISEELPGWESDLAIEEYVRGVVRKQALLSFKEEYAQILDYIEKLKLLEPGQEGAAEVEQEKVKCLTACKKELEQKKERIEREIEILKKQTRERESKASTFLEFFRDVGLMAKQVLAEGNDQAAEKVTI
jgi:hypothetical protein